MKPVITLILLFSVFLTSTIVAQTNLKVEDFVRTYKTTKDAQLLDVRTPGEWEKGKLKKAECVDFMGQDFRQKVAVLDKSKPVFVYCASGGRSAKASGLLKTLGFTKIYNLADAGYGQLKASGIEE